MIIKYRDNVERESTNVQITQKYEKEEEILNEKIKRSPDERHA